MTKQQRQASPTVIDVFAGAGGLSLGAARAGFEVKAAVEIDKPALETHKRNFPLTIHVEQDASTLSGDDLLLISDLGDVALDGLIGGPPCQGFSVIGRRSETDSRNNLFVHFYRLIKETQPKFFLAENVPGILNVKFDKVREEAFKEVAGDYVLLPPFIVNASEYGAPTTRTRVFFIGYKNDLVNPFTHDSLLSSKDVQKVYVKDALHGLPSKICSQWLSEESGWQKIGNVPETEFMKKAVGQIPLGIGDKDSVDRYLNRQEISGCMGTRHTKAVEDRYADLVLGKRCKISKAPKLDPDGFCPTIRAGTGSDRGRAMAVRPVHPTENRVVTPREAARLQGFPDWFIFHRTKWHSFRQIGNSVSPIVAESLLKVIRTNLIV